MREHSTNEFGLFLIVDQAITAAMDGAHAGG